MRERVLRRRCQRLLRELGVRPPLDVRLLARRLADKRGRPIRLIAYPIEVPGPFGLWLATESADYILYQQDTTRPHQDHIILHEIGHIIGDHRSDDQDDAVWQTLMDGPDPTAVRRALRRTAYDNEQEHEAEMIATIILEWASVPFGVRPLDSADETAEFVSGALGHQQGW